MSNNIEKKRKFLQFQLSNRFSNTMPNALYQALNNPSRKTENCAYRINKYVSENQNFVSEFYNTMNSTHKKGLYLFDAPQGSGVSEPVVFWRPLHCCGASLPCCIRTAQLPGSSSMTSCSPLLL